MKIDYAHREITPSFDQQVYLAGFGQNRQAETMSMSKRVGPALMAAVMNYYRNYRTSSPS